MSGKKINSTDSNGATQNRDSFHIWNAGSKKRYPSFHIWNANGQKQPFFRFCVARIESHLQVTNIYKLIGNYLKEPDMSGRRQQDKFTPPAKFSMRICKRCKCDFEIGGSLEPYEMKSGIIQTLCHSCAFTLWSEIKRQDND